MFTQLIERRQRQWYILTPYRKRWRGKEDGHKNNGAYAGIPFQFLKNGLESDQTPPFACVVELGKRITQP